MHGRSRKDLRLSHLYSAGRGGERTAIGCTHFTLSRKARAGGGTRFVHGRSRKTIDPRVPTMTGRSMLGVFTDQADIACTKCEAP